MFDPRSFNRLVMTIAVFRKYLQGRDKKRSFILPTQCEVRFIKSPSLIASYDLVWVVFSNFYIVPCFLMRFVNFVLQFIFYNFIHIVHSLCP